MFKQVKHNVGFTCDHCLGHVQGVRYKCLLCFDFDVCDFCQDEHPVDHPLIKIRAPMDKSWHQGFVVLNLLPNILSEVHLRGKSKHAAGQRELSPKMYLSLVKFMEAGLKEWKMPNLQETITSLQNTTRVYAMKKLDFVNPIIKGVKEDVEKAANKESVHEMSPSTSQRVHRFFNSAIDKLEIIFDLVEAPLVSEVNGISSVLMSSQAVPDSDTVKQITKDEVRMSSSASQAQHVCTCRPEDTSLLHSKSDHTGRLAPASGMNVDSNDSSITNIDTTTINATTIASSALDSKPDSKVGGPRYNLMMADSDSNTSLDVIDQSMKKSTSISSLTSATSDVNSATHVNSAPNFNSPQNHVNKSPIASVNSAPEGNVDYTSELLEMKTVTTPKLSRTSKTIISTDLYEESLEPVFIHQPLEPDIDDLAEAYNKEQKDKKESKRRKGLGALVLGLRKKSSNENAPTSSRSSPLAYSSSHAATHPSRSPSVTSVESLAYESGYESANESPLQPPSASEKAPDSPSSDFKRSLPGFSKADKGKVLLVPPRWSKDEPYLGPRVEVKEKGIEGKKKKKGGKMLSKNGNEKDVENELSFNEVITVNEDRINENIFIKYFIILSVLASLGLGIVFNNLQEYEALPLTRLVSESDEPSEPEIEPRGYFIFFGMINLLSVFDLLGGILLIMLCLPKEKPTTIDIFYSFGTVVGLGFLCYYSIGETGDMSFVGKFFYLSAPFLSAVFMFCLDNVLRGNRGIQDYAYVSKLLNQENSTAVTDYEFNSPRTVDELKLVRRKWDRQLPLYYSKYDFSDWQPSIRRELASPFFALICEGVNLVDHWFHKMNAVAVLDFFYFNSAFLMTSVLFYYVYPLRFLLYYIIFSCYISLVTISYLFEKGVKYDWLKPFWVYTSLFYSCFLFFIGNYHSGNSDVNFAFHLSFILTFSWSFAYLLMMLMNPTIRTCTFRNLMTSISSWIRTRSGLIAIAIHMFTYSMLYMFSLSTAATTLIPLCLVGLLLGVIILPINIKWAILVHIPVSIILLSSSHHLSEVQQGVILDSIESYLPGPIVTNLKMILDVHCMSGLAGLMCFGLWFWELFTSLSIVYEKCDQLFPRVPKLSRYIIGSFQLAVHYFSAVMLFTIAEEEENSSLYFIQTAIAFGILFTGMQPFLPMKLNIDTAKDVARATVPMDKLGEVMSGDINVDDYIDDVRRAGMKHTKKAIKSAIKRKEIASNGQLIIDNEHPIFFWPPIMFVLMLRIGQIAGGNIFVDGLVFGLVVFSVAYVVFQIKNIFFTIFLCIVCFYLSVVNEYVVFSVISGVALYFFAWLFMKQLVGNNGTYILGIIGFLFLVHYNLDTGGTVDGVDGSSTAENETQSLIFLIQMRIDEFINFVISLVNVTQTNLREKEISTQLLHWTQSFFSEFD